ncbi:MAG: helix-turn-helix domain-containing protein [Bacteroidetes bacterium]|nr:helix-turn-helix domain-containing protein [Bacteroidota bacterium]
MEVITIDSTAFKQILENINSLEKRFEEIALKASSPLGEKWLDIQDVCQELNISKRTLQTWRDQNLIPYSMIGKKIYYKSTDVVKFLMINHHKVKGF